MLYCWKTYKLLIIIDNKWLPLMVIFQGSKSVSDMFFFSAQREKLNIRVNTRGDREMAAESIKSVVMDHVVDTTIQQFGCLLLMNTALPLGGVQRIRAYPFTKGPRKASFHAKNPQDVVGIVPDRIEKVSP